MAGGLHGIMAEFEAPERLLEAARKTRDAGYRSLDAFTPYPVHGLKEILGFKDRLIQGTMLAGGILGAVAGFGMQTWATVFHYPHNIGGRPYFSWPAYIIITFEITVLFAGLSGLLGLLIHNRLPALHHPVFNVPAFARATRDRFFLIIHASDPAFRPEKVRDFLGTLRPVGVSDVET
jgi:hypothetical protein